jgi:hypothetical protein
MGSVSAQARLGQVEIALNPAQDFIIDHILVAQLNDRSPLNSESLLLKALEQRHGTTFTSLGT